MKDVTRGLYWFRNDLRLDNNPSLNTLNDLCDELVFVYVFDATLLEKTPFQLSRIAKPRLTFIRECLSDLSQQLEQQQQKLIIKVGNPDQIIADLINQYRIDAVAFTSLSGVYEKRQISRLKADFKNQVTFYSDESFTLFREKQLPFALDEMPDGFSPFRKKIERTLSSKDSIKHIVTTPPAFAPPIAGMESIMSEPLPTIDGIEHPSSAMKHQGGERAAQEQLNYYSFQTQQLSQYKETRNGLDGWDFSSKLSAYLAQGCLSPQQVMKTVLNYEEEFGSNESTYWLYFELLWREFYQWHQEKHQSHLYLKQGIQGIDPELAYEQSLFKQWKNGETSSDFVNAFMLQLKHTGWMSNRGRQIVASYLLNQLQLDWRYGAAWFEKQLIDYDSASNWGNWQYLAGVGVDPRGRRAFNIEKQRKTYDPDRHFTHSFVSH